MTTPLIPYLIEYLSWLKNGGLQRTKFYLDKQKLHVDTLISDYVKFHPECKQLLNYQYPMYGGESSFEKLNKIYNKIKLINPENLSTTVQDTHELDTLIKQLQDKIDHLSKIEQENYATKVTGDYVQTTIEQIKAGIRNLKDIEVSKEVVEIPTLINPINYSPVNADEIFTSFKTKIEKLQKSSNKEKENIDLYLKKIDDEITLKLQEVKKNNENIQKSISELNQNISLVNDFKYNIEKNELKFVPEFNLFLDELKNANINDDVNDKINELSEKLKHKENKMRDIIDDFNAAIVSYLNQIHDKTKYKNFYKYYNGINNTRINNMFFVRKGVADIPMIRDIMNIDSKEIIDLNLKNLDTTDLSKLFIEFPLQFQKQKGGEYMNDVLKRNTELLGELQKYNENIKVYNEMIIECNSNLIHSLMHNVFLVTIATNQLLIPGYVIHEYIQRGTLSLYRRILTNMKNDIEKNPEKKQNVYLLKYHKITIYKLYNFVVALTDFLNNKKGERIKSCKKEEVKICVQDDIIDINECTGKTQECFLLLNHFKEILMQYNALYSSKVTIYARINDLADTMLPTTKDSCQQMTYLSDFDLIARDGICTESTEPKFKNIDVQKMEVNYASCKAIGPDTETIKDIKFTEVFDSTQYPTSSDISKYMTVESLLSQGRGIAMMTYGYSGTGKTFTLFGNSAKNISGILQSTLEDINGLQFIQFRLLELYGLGMPYPHYWEQGLEKINHKIIQYQTMHNNEGLHVIDTKDISPVDFKTFINNGKTYDTVQSSMVPEVFKRFEDFVISVDDIRMKNGRIRDTPNNPVSSRSVVVYDFQLKLYGTEKLIPFLIIDLPGREEILQTYIEPYLNNKIIQNILDLNPESSEFKKIKLILSLAALNPLGLAVFEPEIILSKIKNLNDHDRNELLKPMNMTFTLKKSIEQKNNLKISKINENEFSVTGLFSLSEEIINPLGIPLSKWFTISDKGKFSFKHTDIRTGFGYSTDKQLESVLCTHLLNRIIMTNNFDLLKDIIKEICNKYINKKIQEKIKTISSSIKDDLAKTNFKSKYWTNETPLSEILEYNYYLTPYEGIYINENIIGLIKYLAKVAQKKDDTIESENYAEQFVKDTICKQDESLTFSHQQKIVRIWNMTKDIKTDEEIKDFFLFDKEKVQKDVPTKCVHAETGLIPKRFIEITSGKITYDTTIFDEMYNELKESYHSDHIFNFNKPIITDVLDYYIKNIFDYKILYLLANYKETSKRESRCGHQYKLLKNTEDFIASISGVYEKK